MTKAPIDYFDEGMQARAKRKRRRDNPYCLCSDEHREWDAGFCATEECEDEGDLVSRPRWATADFRVREAV